ncbi:hypothetical protein [Streptosporangium sp. NPDC001681]|uniref:hypothetical protein n=1 Tax=Streptosporangium sp. NPDC001681 TaxID=3154395 RepID=UPI00332A9A80
MLIDRKDIELHMWTFRQWLVGLIAAVVTALAVGVPTGIVETSLFTRMTPVLWWNYPVWGLTAILTGLITATYVAPVQPPPSQQKRTLIGGLLSAFAVGCPICNKLVVMALGVSGAFTYFAPVQPILAVGSVILLAEALRRRMRALRSCRPDLRSSGPASSLRNSV